VGSDVRLAMKATPALLSRRGDLPGASAGLHGIPNPHSPLTCGRAFAYSVDEFVTNTMPP